MADFMTCLLNYIATCREEMFLQRIEIECHINIVQKVRENKELKMVTFEER